MWSPIVTPFESVLAHGALHLGDGRGDILHGERCEGAEAIGVAARPARQLVIARARDHLRDLRVEGVLEEAGVDRQAVHVDAHLIHLRHAVGRRDGELRDVELADVGPEPEPLTAILDGVAEDLRSDVIVDIDDRHRPPFVI